MTGGLLGAERQGGSHALSLLLAAPCVCKVWPQTGPAAPLPYLVCVCFNRSLGALAAAALLEVRSRARLGLVDWLWAALCLGKPWMTCETLVSFRKEMEAAEREGVGLTNTVRPLLVGGWGGCGPVRVWR